MLYLQCELMSHASTADAAHVLHPCSTSTLQIHQDKLTQTAQKLWSAKALSSKTPPAFQPELVASIYRDELAGGRDAPPALKRVMLLEVSQYLENYLWPNFDGATASFEHIMSIILMVNEKFREGVPAWTFFHTREVGKAHACTASLLWRAAVALALVLCCCDAQGSYEVHAFAAKARGMCCLLVHSS